MRFIKLDLEGGEFDAFRGASRTLERDRPLLVFESARKPAADAYGYDVDAWFAIFENAGYDLWDILGRRFSRAAFEMTIAPWYLVGLPADSAEHGHIPELLPLLAQLP